MKGKRAAAARKGLITWGTLLSVLFLLILVSLISNTSITVSRKMETQNTADAVAYSSATWMARGMNAVTATNHIIGELNALYVIHHALGGKWLDEHHIDKKRNNGDWSLIVPPFGYGGATFQLTNFSLDTQFPIALALSLATPAKKPKQSHKDRVRKNPIADVNSTIFEVKEMLKMQMSVAYGAHIAGGLLYWQGFALVQTGYPPLVAAGTAMMTSGVNAMNAAYATQQAIHAQYLVWDQIEAFAILVAPFKLAIPRAIQVIYLYQSMKLMQGIPEQASETAGQIGEKYECDGFVNGASLPLVPDLHIKEENSQLIRATFPWVRTWRRRPAMAMTVGGLSVFPPPIHSYRKWTHRYTFQACQWMRTPPWYYYRNELTVKNFRGSMHVFGTVPLGSVNPALPTIVARDLPASPLSSKRVANDRGVSRLASTRQNPNTLTAGPPRSERTPKHVLANRMSFPSTANNRGMPGLGIWLMVINGLNGEGEKGRETWNKGGIWGSLKADKYFCCLGFALSEKPNVLSTGFFRQENPHGMLCYSQAMIYNLNSQPSYDDAKGTGGGSDNSNADQTQVGWDTLAWDPNERRVREWREKGWSDFFSDSDASSPPRIKLNWQAKLTPLTVVKMIKTLPKLILHGKRVRKIVINSQLEQIPLQNH